MAITLSPPPDLQVLIESLAAERGETVEALALAALVEYVENETDAREVEKRIGPIYSDVPTTDSFQEQIVALIDAARAEAFAAGDSLLDLAGINREIAERRGGTYREEP